MTFQPGQSGNPTGQRRDKPFRDALNLAIKESHGDRLKLRAVAESLVEKAIAGDVSAIKEVADRLDGKVPQQQILTGDEDAPIRTVNRIELVDLVGSTSSSPAKD